MRQQYEVSLSTEYIELFKLIKRENIAASGGEAKQMIDAGYVLVNGEPEGRKRRKIRVSDRVECFNVCLLVVAAASEPHR